MKTISLKKKVAALAVASLGLGLLSVAPASAATPNDEAVVHSFAVTNAGYVQDLTTATVNAANPVAQGVPFTADLKIAINASTETIASGDKATITFAVTNPNNVAITSSCTFAASAATVFTNLGSTMSANVLTLLASGANTANNAAATVATVSCPTSMGGIYKVSSTTVGNVGFGGTHTELDGTTVVKGAVLVSGAGVTVATDGVSTTTAAGVVGGEVRLTYTTGKQAPAQVNFARSTGVGSITSAALNTSAGAKSATVLVNTSDTSSPSVATIDGISYASGARLVGGGLVASGATSFTSTLSQYLLVVSSGTAGTQTVTISTNNATTGAPTTLATVTITWGAAPTLSTSNSKAYLSAGNDTTTLGADDSVVLLPSTAAATIVANIQVTLKNDVDAAANGRLLTVSVEGPGLIGVDAGTQDGVSATANSRIYSDTSANANNLWQIGIAADGTSGVSKITIKVGDTVIATKSLTFYGSAAKYTATPILIATADGNATTDAVVVCAVDTAGVVVPGATIYAVSGDTAVANVAASSTTVSAAVLEDVDTGSAGTALIPTAYQAAKGVGCAGFAVTGAAQTLKDSVVITFRNGTTAALSTVSTTATVKVGSVAASTVTLSSDKATYAAGEKMVLTMTFKDAQGRLVGAGPGTGTLDAALTSSSGLTGDALFATANNSKQGTSTATVYAPLTAGNVKISGTTGINTTFLATAARGQVLSLDLKVTSAIDAQIASLIAAIAKLQKAINKINKRLNR